MKRIYSSLSKREKCAGMSIFLLIVLSISFVISNDIFSHDVTIGLWLILLALAVYIGKGKFNKRVVTIVDVLGIMMLITDVLNGENINVYMKSVFSYIVAATLVNIY